ncbi:MAG TPA: hypothetical protein VF101_06540 [Gaiellaceae bacterium]
MAEAAPRAPETPPVDPFAIDRAYRLERARRRARLDRSHASRQAGLRFAFVLVLLLLCALAFALATRREVQQLFGL